MSSNTHYISAAIPYVNAAPHLGHALGFVLADASARHRRLLGDDVCFVTGTDENSLKSVRAAERAGRPVAELVGACAERFRALAAVLEVEPDRFVRTSVDPQHAATVERLWRACDERGDLYRRTYRGLYCVGCEDFYRERDLAGGVCPEHGVPPEPVEEENWFFRLSRHQDAIAHALRSGEISISPEERRNEAIAFVEAGLEDFSVSRSRKRARGWGLPVPGDPDQIVFVWFDALANYLSALELDTPSYERYWANCPKRVHVIGKGILRFHAVYWPAILRSAGVPLPTAIQVHGYLTASGLKIGKSLGNAVEPGAVIDAHGAVALRHYLLRHVPTTKDADFSSERLADAFATDLADQLGNLVQRSVALIGERVAQPGAPGELEQELLLAADAARRGVEHGFESFDLRHAAESAWRFVASANRYVDRAAPWRLERGSERRNTVEHTLAEALRQCSVLLASLLPSTAREVARRVGAAWPPAPWTEHARWGATRAGAEPCAGPPLFPKRARRVQL